MSSLILNSGFDIFGLGHSMIDHSAMVDFNTLASLGVNKGEQHFVDEAEVRSSLEKLSGKVHVNVGGNVRNTLLGVSSLGGKVTYCSAIGADKLGKLARKSLATDGIGDNLYTGGGHTPISLILVTPDGDRSMITFPGDDCWENSGTLDVDTITHSKILYTSAYMINHTHRAAFLKRCIQKAYQVGTLIAFDLADPVIVHDYRDQIRQMIDRGLIDVLFGNCGEMEILFGDDYVSKINSIHDNVPIVVLKQGADGATITTNRGGYSVFAPAQKVIDTTAAGDMFAAGFLYGLLNGYSIEACAQFAAFMASDTIANVGAVLSSDINAKAHTYLTTLDCPVNLAPAKREAWVAQFKQMYCKNRFRDLIMKVQVAGIQDIHEARMLIAAGVGMIGFPLHLPVHKQDISEEAVADIIRQLGIPERCLLITYLNKYDDILRLAAKIGVRNIQLHGEISVGEIEMIRERVDDYFIIKSIVVSPNSTIGYLEKIIEEYSHCVDAFIIDTFDPTTGASGATGKTQDWSISKRLVEFSKRPIILAGGLTPQNVREAIFFVRPDGVDVHTGVESDDGSKNIFLVKEFVGVSHQGFLNLF